MAANTVQPRLRAYERSRLWARALLRELMYLRGRDVTDLVSSRGRTLVVAPHPDDETLGCGATIARIRAAGGRVRIVIVTDGGASHDAAQIAAAELTRLRAVEAAAACARLGVAGADVRLLDFRDRQTDGRPDELEASIFAEIAAFGPDQIFYPSTIDRHPDHRAVALAVERVLRNRPKAATAYSYPVWFWRLREWARPQGLSARASLRVRKVKSEPYLSIKRAAADCHKSQLRGLDGSKVTRVLGDELLDCFFGRYELFFELTG